MKKLIWLVVIVVIIILIVLGVSDSGSREVSNNDGKIKIGVITVSTGPLAVWGEETSDGIQMALEDLGEESENIEVIFEDSAGDPALGLSAYNKLVTNDNVDIVISMFSRVSVPLTKRAQEDEIPLIMTLVSSMDAISEDNPWAHRVFHNAERQGPIHFDQYEKLGVNKIGLLWLNDEFGKSVADVVKKEAADRGIVVEDYSYLPQDTDYRTQVAKIKNFEPDAFTFIGIPPISITNAIKQSREFGLDVPIFETAAILQNPAVVESLGELAEGVYSISTPFDLGQRSTDIYDRAFEKNNKKPSFAVSFSYDIINLINQVSENGKHKEKDFIDRLSKLETFEGVTSSYKLNGKGEINPELFPVQIVNGLPVIVD